jgi:hypothetical protein
VGSFDDFESLFQTLGLSEAGAKVAAIGRYRNEAEAREADRVAEAEGLADDLLAEAQNRPSVTSQEVAQMQAAIPTVAANAVRLAQGLPAQPLPWQQTLALPLAAESIVTTVREALRMTDTDARQFAGRLHQREAHRGGQDHADKFLASLEGALRGKNGRLVREVAPR